MNFVLRIPSSVFIRVTLHECVRRKKYAVSSCQADRPVQTVCSMCSRRLDVCLHVYIQGAGAGRRKEGLEGGREGGGGGLWWWGDWLFIC